MPTHVSVDLPNEIKWPQRCTVCGSRDEKRLVNFKTDKEKTTSLSIPIPGIGTLGYSNTSSIEIEYPICDECVNKNKFYELISNKVGKIGSAMMAYGFFVAVVTMTGPKVVQIHFVNIVAWLSFVAGIFMLIAGAIAASKLAVRVHNVSKNHAEIVILNNLYAQDFQEANSQYARFISLTKSLIGLKR